MGGLTVRIRSEEVAAMAVDPEHMGSAQVGCLMILVCERLLIGSR